MHAAHAVLVAGAGWGGGQLCPQLSTPVALWFIKIVSIKVCGLYLLGKVSHCALCPLLALQGDVSLIWGHGELGGVQGTEAMGGRWHRGMSLLPKTSKIPGSACFWRDQGALGTSCAANCWPQVAPHLPVRLVLRAPGWL